MLAFFGKVCYSTQALRRASKYPGVAKFGIALEWGSRGLEFESRHSDQSRKVSVETFLDFIFAVIFTDCLIRKEEFYENTIKTQYPVDASPDGNGSGLADYGRTADANGGTIY